MQTLPNGLKVFNSTPHVIHFWMPGWEDVTEVPSHGRVDAKPVEREVPSGIDGVTAVETVFEATPEGEAIVEAAYASGADVVIGSVLAAQAYPGRVYAMVPAPGYERVPVPLPRDVMDALLAVVNGDRQTAEVYGLVGVFDKYTNLPTKRVLPNKFTVFPAPTENRVLGQPVTVELNYPLGDDGVLAAREAITKVWPSAEFESAGDNGFRVTVDRPADGLYGVKDGRWVRVDHVEYDGSDFWVGNGDVGLFHYNGPDTGETILCTGAGVKSGNPFMSWEVEQD